MYSTCSACVSVTWAQRLIAYERAGYTGQQVPLAPTSADIAALPDAAFPAGHAVHYVASPAHLPGGQLDVRPLLFPAGHRRNNRHGHGGGDCSQFADVIGFDVEWRPNMGRNASPGWGKCNADHSPAAVVQLSSVHATVVVNLYALGTAMQPGVAPSQACAAALPAVQAILSDEALLKVGLNCTDDRMRLSWLCPSLQLSNVIDAQARASPVSSAL